MDRYAAQRWADIRVADGYGIEHSSFLEGVPDFGWNQANFSKLAGRENCMVNVEVMKYRMFEAPLK